MKHTKAPFKQDKPLSFDEIIKYDQYARKLQSEAIFSCFKYLTKSLQRIFGNKTN